VQVESTKQRELASIRAT